MIDSETALIGSLLVDARRFDQVSRICQPEYFLDPTLRGCFESIGEIASECPAGRVDVSRLAHVMDSKGLGAEFTRDVPKFGQSVATGWDYEWHARRVTESALRRHLESMGVDIQNHSSDPHTAAEELVGDVMERIGSIGFKETEHGRSMTLKTAIDELLFPKVESELSGGGQKTVRVRFGIPPIDAVTYGIPRGSLVVLGGRPGEGKTSMACNLACQMGMNAGRRILFISLEQPLAEIADVMVRSCAQCGPITAELSQEESDERFELMKAERDKLYASQIEIVEGSKVGRQWLEAQIKLRQLNSSLDVVFVDYLQLVKRQGRDPVTYQIQEITSSLKQLAKLHNIVIVLLCQLNRDYERDSKGSKTLIEPQLRHLKDSGAIEQDGDVVCFVWLDQQEREDGLRNAWFKVAKNRHGNRGTVEMIFDGSCKRFYTVSECERAIDESEWGDAFDAFNDR